MGCVDERERAKRGKKGKGVEVVIRYYGVFWGEHTHIHTYIYIYISSKMENRIDTVS